MTTLRHRMMNPTMVCVQTFSNRGRLQVIKNDASFVVRSKAVRREVRLLHAPAKINLEINKLRRIFVHYCSPLVNIPRSIRWKRAVISKHVISLIKLSNSCIHHVTEFSQEVVSLTRAVF